MRREPDVITLAVAQWAMAQGSAQNIDRASALVREAAAKGAQVVLLPELFAGPYFPRQRREQDFQRASSLEQSQVVKVLSRLAQQLQIVLPISFFERADGGCYNSVAVVDADGSILGVYRKTHIPDGPGYWERFYFQPGDAGFRVWHTRHGCFGLGICWDQWFPECARAMALMGADILLYPSAIGSEPQHPDLDTKDAWQRVMIGHAAANATPVAAANRVGDEGGQVFYGSSFVADHCGDKLAELGRRDEAVALARLDLKEARRYRRFFGLLADRRPELYTRLTETES